MALGRCPPDRLRLWLAVSAGGGKLCPFAFPPPCAPGEAKPAKARKAKPAAAEPSPEQAELAERLLQRYTREATQGAIATLAPHLTLGGWNREEELRREVLATMVAQGVGLTDVGIATRLRESHGRLERTAARRAEGNRVGKDPVVGGLARMAAEEAVTRTGRASAGGKWPPSWA